MKRVVVICAIALFASACAGSTEPSVAQVGGNWVGQLSFTRDTGPVSQDVALTLAQSGNQVTGTWAATSGTSRRGEVTGTTTPSSFAGFFTYRSTSGICNGSFKVTGTAGGNSVTWTSPAVVEDCTNQPTNMTFVLTKQQ